MGKSSGSAPAAPDPVATAAAQSKSNIDTANATAGLNRVNQVTPQGALTYTQGNGAKWDEQAYLAANPDVAGHIADGSYKGTGLQHYTDLGKGEGRSGVAAGYDPNAPWTATQSYSPEQQKLYDLSTQAQTAYGEAGLAQLGKLREQMSTPFSFQGAPDYQSVASRSGQVQTGYDRGGQIQTGYDTGGPIQRSVGPNDFSADRTRVEEALYGRLNPSLDAARTGLETRLRSQGLAPGSEAWTNAMRTQTMSENDARLGVTAQGLAEQQGMFGMDLSRGTFANNAQQQAYNQNASLAAFGNNAQAQQYGQNQGLAQFGNQAALQQQNMDTGAGTYGQQQRQQMLAEQLAIRNQPLNETSALLTGSQVQSPQFTNVPGAQVANTDVISPYNTQYQGQLAGYQGGVQSANANTGAAAGAAGTAVMAGAVII